MDLEKSLNSYQVGEYYLMVNNHVMMIPYSVLYQITKSRYLKTLYSDSELLNIVVEADVLATQGPAPDVLHNGKSIVITLGDTVDRYSHQLSEEEATEWILKNQ